MSGLEVLGAVSAASTLLEVAIGIIERFRKAYERHKHLKKVLNSVRDELMNIKNIIQIVKDEKALRTADIASQLARIKALTGRLIDYLKAIDPNTKSSMRQLTHQLVRGSKNEKTLANIMDELGHEKSSLSLYIQVANVGLTRTVEDTTTANAEVVNQINLVLQQVFGEGRDLELAELLKNRPARDDDMVSISDGDIACFSAEVASPPNDTDTIPKPVANEPTSRIVTYNSTEGQALQVNGPIGEKGWWEVSHLEIKNNKAADTSIQVNHGTSMDVFDRLLAARSASAPK